MDGAEVFAAPGACIGIAGIDTSELSHIGQRVRRAQATCEEVLVWKTGEVSRDVFESAL